MESKIEKLPHSRVKITVKLTKIEFDEFYQQALDELAKSVRLPGFRAGKVPADLAEQHLGADRVKAEAIEKAIPSSYYDCIMEHHLHPLHHPEVSLQELKDGLSYEAAVDVLPEVQINNWQKISVKSHAPAAVGADDVSRIIHQLQKERAQLNETSSPVQKGYLVRISFTGKVDGVKHEGMESKNHPLVVGEGTLIPGFEDELVGMKKDEEKTFTITFPKDYRDRDLAKKKAEFSVKLEDVKEVILPEIDDKFAKLFGKDSVKDLEKAIEDELKAENEREAKHQNEEAVLAELVKRTKVELPKSLIEKEIDRLIEHIKERFGGDEIQFNLWLEQQKKTMENLREDAKDQAVKNVTIGLALGEMMKEEKVDPDDKEAVKKMMDRLLESAFK